MMIYYYNQKIFVCQNFIGVQKKEFLVTYVVCEKITNIDILA